MFQHRGILEMTLAHPALTMAGKRKSKRKFRNAEEARKHRELAESWNNKQIEWKSMSKPVTKPLVTKLQYFLPKVPPGRESTKIPSLDTKVKGAVTVKQTQHYTGTEVIGISQMAKSNAVPVFSKQAIIDIGKMRRG